MTGLEEKNTISAVSTKGSIANDTPWIKVQETTPRMLLYALIVTVSPWNRDANEMSINSRMGRLLHIHTIESYPAMGINKLQLLNNNKD